MPFISDTTRFTFLMPAYKARFLRESIRSILAQTYADFRLIVSDDCSPEDLKSIVGEFLDDPRVSFRRNEVNMGGKSLVSHWNLLLSLAETEFVVLATDDDVYEPTFLETFHRLAEKYPAANVFRSRICNIDRRGGILWIDRCYKEFLTEAELYYHYMHGFHGGIPQYAFRRKPLLDHGGFVDFPLAWGSDDATALMMGRGGMVNAQEMLVSFRWSDINVSSKRDKRTNRQKLEARIRLFNWLQERVAQINFPEGKHGACLKKSVSDYCPIFIRLLLIAIFGSYNWRDRILAYRELKKIAGFTWKDTMSVVVRTTPIIKNII